MRLAIWFTAFGACIGVSEGAAWAHPGYPSKLQMQLMLGYVPGCETCHESAGGSGPLNRFGTLLTTYGLSTDMGQEEDSSLVGAIDALAMAQPQALVDLTNHVNPASDGSLFTNQVTPEYGCSASPGADSNESAACLGLAALWLLGARRRVPRRLTMTSR